ncbi:hypothetical protein [Actinotalea subterranea]|uniref:hypothetical protein n=1 Tax=Actinotalea subterranea TaxID=2607497 RepID=UPI0011ECD2B8|nr:hypothetical protein [Actinotalea subterranea]
MSDEGLSADVPMDADDLAVLAELARLFERVDPPPRGLVDRTLFALTLEALQTQVMELQHLEQPALSVRGDGGAPGRESVEARTITFTADAVTVMITLSEGPHGGVRIDGWSAPATRFVVDLYRPDDHLQTESDDDGAFVIPDVPPGLASLVLRRADGAGPAVSTPVIEL